MSVKLKRRWPVWLITPALMAMALSLSTSQPAAAATVTQVTNFGSNPGGSKMYIYVPDGMTPNAALVVVPNAATTTTADLAVFGWQQLADRWKNFAIVYDEHTANNNTCGYDVDTANGRGGTEMVSTKQMVDYMQATYSIDSNKTFSAGLSCGAIMGYYMGAMYPDLYEAVQGSAGIEWRCPNGGGSGCSQTPPTRRHSNWVTLSVRSSRRAGPGSGQGCRSGTVAKTSTSGRHTSRRSSTSSRTSTASTRQPM